jgi:hypothetical protein
MLSSALSISGIPDITLSNAAIIALLFHETDAKEKAKYAYSLCKRLCFLHL